MHSIFSLSQLCSAHVNPFSLEHGQIMTLQTLILDFPAQIKKQEGVEVINVLLLINYFRLSVFLATCPGQWAVKKKKKKAFIISEPMWDSPALCVNCATVSDNIQNRDLLRDQDK